MTHLSALGTIHEQTFVLLTTTAYPFSRYITDTLITLPESYTLYMMQQTRSILRNIAKHRDTLHHTIRETVGTTKDRSRAKKRQRYTGIRELLNPY